MSTKRPKISALMTVYNGEAFLQEALEAIFNQTFTDFEVVVVNNGSTDGTQAILDTIDDPRLRVVHPKAHGSVGDGLRLAYRNVQGEFIAVQDADDVSAPDRFARQLAAFEADPRLGLVASAYRQVDVTGEPLAEVHPPTDPQVLVETFLVTNPLAHSSIMFRREATDGVGGYPQNYVYGSDFGLILAVLKAGWRIRVLDELLLDLRMHPGQASSAPELNLVRQYEAMKLFETAMQLDGISPNARTAGRRNLVKRTLVYGMCLLSAGQVAQGLKRVGGTLLRHPMYGGAYLGYRLMRKMGLVRP